VTSTPDARATYREAIRLAMRDSLRADENVVLLGEDIGAAGGVFKVTDGLFAEFGPSRVMDTPISETGFVGAAIGLALAGFRPVVELMFADFAAVAWDQLANQAAKYLFLSAGQMHVPMVIRCAGGGGGRFGAQHSQTTESWYLGIPGLKAVIPSNPQDAYGLLLSAVADDGPVVYLEHRGLYPREGSFDPQGAPVPLGTAAIARMGRDVTIVASLAMVPKALSAAQTLSADGIDAEVIDLRSLVPLDVDTILKSVRRTTRLVTVEEEPLRGSWSSDVVAEVATVVFDSLDAPPVRVGLPEAPLAFSPTLEDAAIPSESRIVEAVRQVMA
jgi:pyruvate dehydrogenase E1 component beta subunit